MHDSKEIKALKRELKATQIQLARLQEKLKFLSSSTSWKITKPLRLLSKLFQIVRIEWRRGLEFQWPEDFQKLLRNLRTELPVAFPYAPKPLVSIIIPVYGKLSYTLRCLKSIAAFPPACSFEIIIMDDASPDNTYEVLTKIRGLHIFRQTSNVGFIRNCNKAADIARGEFLLFLNNDTTVLPHWCDALVETFTHYPDTGLAGSKFIFSSKKLQEAGSIIWKDGSAWNYGSRKQADKPEFNYVKEVDYCSGASICIRQSLFKTLGGFDEYYLPAYCEDSDLAFKVRGAGYKVIYQPFSCIIHYRGITHGRFTFSGIKTYQVKNQQKLYERWKDILKKENFPLGEKVFWARDRSFNKPTILFIDHAVPKYDTNAGDKTMKLYLELFVQAGFNVKLWTKDNNYDPIYTPYYQKMGIEVFYGNTYWKNNFTHWLKQYGSYFQYVFMSRLEVAEKFLSVIKKTTSAKLLYYGHDIYHLRMQAQHTINAAITPYDSVQRIQEREQKIWSAVDVIYYPSSEESEYVKKYIGTTVDKNKIVRHIPAYYYLSDEKNSIEPLAFSERKGLLFVGNFRHPPNVDGIVWFIQEVLPLIHTSHPEVIVYVVGANPPAKINQLQNDKVILTGFLEDEELLEYYESCRLSIAPLRYGAGVKGKVIDALNQRLPVITTSFGAQGIPDAESAMIIHDVAQEMAKALIDIYDDQQKWQDLVAAGNRIIEKYYSRQAVANVFSLDIPEVSL